jgi:hypothetical protein
MLEHLAESEKRLRKWMQSRRGRDHGRPVVAFARQRKGA